MATDDTRWWLANTPVFVRRFERELALERLKKLCEQGFFSVSDFKECVHLNSLHVYRTRFELAVAYCDPSTISAVILVEFSLRTKWQCYVTALWPPR